MVTKVEENHEGGFMVSEANGYRSREQVVLAASQAVKVGQVLGAVVGTLTAAVSGIAGSVGNGTLTMDGATPILAKARLGEYTVVCSEKTANSGKFRVERPDGSFVGTASVGVAFAKEIKFTIADGATDFEIGDGFIVKVSSASATVKALDLAATDGAEIATHIAWAAKTSSADATVRLATIARDCEVRGVDLVWPAGITADQKKIAIAQLAERGIIVR